MKRSFVGSGMMFGFLLAAIVVVVSGVLIHRNIQTIAENEARVSHSYQVLNALTGIRSSLITAESSQRGYLITVNRDNLKAYQEAIPRIESLLAEVSRLIEGDAAQSVNFQELGKSVNDRLASLAEGIGIVENNGEQAARDFILRGRGFAQMRQVDDSLERMIAEERRLLEIRDAESRASHLATSQTALLSSVVGLSMVLLAGYLSLREVTQQEKMTRLLEHRVQERTNELAATNTSLQHSNRELEQFASVASHDLQEPLRKIEAFGDRLKMHRDALNDQSRDYLDRILNSASRMRTLINDLLTFSRVATRAQPFRQVDLAQIAHEVVGDLEGRLHQVDGEVMIGSLPSIEADPTQIRQLFQNLIGNALKFHRPGVKPLVRLSGETLNVDEQPPAVKLTVSDNGIGFEEQYLDRIFEVFQRLHGRHEFEGTGIGLAICRKIVERHRGTISAHSSPGEGSTFIVVLPVEQTGKEESWETADLSSS